MRWQGDGVRYESRKGNVSLSKDKETLTLEHGYGGWGVGREAGRVRIFNETDPPKYITFDIYDKGNIMKKRTTVKVNPDKNYEIAAKFGVTEGYTSVTGLQEHDTDPQPESAGGQSETGREMEDIWNKMKDNAVWVIGIAVIVAIIAIIGVVAYTQLKKTTGAVAQQPQPQPEVLT